MGKLTIPHRIGLIRLWESRLLPDGVTLNNFISILIFTILPYLQALNEPKT